MLPLLRRILAHPLTRGMDIDDPQTTALRSQIILGKPFLVKLYTEWYRRLAVNFTSDAAVLEIGSGAGFMRQFMPSLITSDLYPNPGIDLVINGMDIPFDEASLDGIVMTDVLHHIPDCNLFFKEAARVIKPGGMIAMVEPWNTKWSAFIYKRLHHEPFDPEREEWVFPETGSLSGANSALPWILFHRDRAEFETKHNEWRIDNILPIMPLAYLLSGGVSSKSLLPGWSYRLVRFLESRCWEASWSMFAEITLRRL
jgi:SAM-dependent methyltransferase